MGISTLFCCCGSQAREKIKGANIPTENFLSLKKRAFPRDLYCTIIFILFWIVLIGVSVFAFFTGNPLSLIYASDYDYNICGFDFDQGNENRYNLTQEKYLWYPVQIDVLNPSRMQTYEAISKGWCVTQCPVIAMSIVCHYDYRNESESDKLSWAEQYFTNSSSRSVEKGCAFNQFPTEAVGRRCIPSLSHSKELEFINNATGLPMAPSLTEAQSWFFEQVFHIFHLVFNGLDNIRAAWLPLVLSVMFTLLGCIVFVVLCRLLVGPVAYGILIIVQVVLLLATAASLVMGSWYLMQYLYGTNYDNWFKERTKEVRSDDYRGMQIFYGVGGALGVISLLYFCLMMFLISRIRVAVAVIKESTKAVFQMPSILIIPPLVLTGFLLLTVYYFTVSIFLQSFTRPTMINIPYFSDWSFEVTKDHPVLIVMQMYNLFGFLWTLSFINAVGYCAIAACVAAWFFSRRGDKKRAPLLVSLRALAIVILVHSGSLLFGSLIIAVIQFLKSLYNRLRSRVIVSTNPILKVFDKVLKCCMSILAKILKFFNKNVYIVIAITGHNYCLSVQRAFMLILEHVVQFATVNFMSDFLLFLGKIGIAVLAGVFCWTVIFLHNKFLISLSPVYVEDITQVNAVWMPIAVAVIAGFLVSHIFLSLYETTIDTMFLCYCEDKRANSSSEGGLYMPSSLLRTLSLSQRLGDKKKKKRKKGKLGPRFKKVHPSDGHRSHENGDGDDIYSDDDSN